MKISNLNSDVIIKNNKLILMTPNKNNNKLSRVTLNVSQMKTLALKIYQHKDKIGIHLNKIIKVLMKIN